MKKTLALLVLLLLPVGASASEKTTITGNCNSPRTWAWIPRPDGELATSVLVATKGNRFILGLIACFAGEEGTVHAFSAADLDGVVLMQTGVFGDVCTVAYCTLGGNAKVNLDLTTGSDDSTFDRLSGSSLDIPPGQVVEIDSDRLPRVGEMLGELAERVKRQRANPE